MYQGVAEGAVDLGEGVVEEGVLVEALAVDWMVELAGEEWVGWGAGDRGADLGLGDLEEGGWAVD